ncbi:MAG TPA: hypothetical protein VFY38_00820 [Pseudonocardia sp.]|nr:hypothetical protein [Pseudonocardia sp.]
MTADRTAPAAVVLAGLLAVAGCGATEPASAPPSTAARPDPVAACAAQLTYCNRSGHDASAPDSVRGSRPAPDQDEDLRGAPDQGFDYQERGLTGAQADALADLVARARAQGDALAPDWVATEARERCTAIVARPPSTAGGWP